MSRGPGRIERAIRALFDANTDGAFTTDEVCVYCYDLTSLREVKRKHRVAVVRAARNVVRQIPDWTAWWTTTPGREFVWYNQCSERSTAMGLVLRNSGSDGDRENIETTAHWMLDPPPDLRPGLLEAVLHDQVMVKQRVADHLDRRAHIDPAHLAERTKALSVVRAIGNASKAGAVVYRLRLLDQHQAFAVETARRLRALMVENDPDAIRAGLAEMAEALERLGRQPEEAA